MDIPVPLASVAKVPLALVTLDRIAAGALDPAMPVTIDPATASVGPTGVAAFRYPATLAVADLIHLTLTVSDNASADAFFDLVGVDAVDEQLRAWGCAGIRVRHRMQRMYECAAGVAGNDFGLARELAIRDDAAGHYSIETVDPAHANVGSAADLVHLLQRVWLDRISRPEATAELRRLMALRPHHRHRRPLVLREPALLKRSGSTGHRTYREASRPICPYMSIDHWTRSPSWVTTHLTLSISGWSRRRNQCPRGRNHGLSLQVGPIRRCSGRRLADPGGGGARFGYPRGSGHRDDGLA